MCRRIIIVRNAVTFDVEFTRRHGVTEGTLIFCLVVERQITNHQSMNRPFAHHFVLLSVRFDRGSIFLPRQLDVFVRGHGTRQVDFLTGQCVRVFQTFHELERQRWTPEQ